MRHLWCNTFWYCYIIECSCNVYCKGGKKNWHDCWQNEFCVESVLILHCIHVVIWLFLMKCKEVYEKLLRYLWYAMLFLRNKFGGFKGTLLMIHVHWYLFKIHALIKRVYFVIRYLLWVKMEVLLICEVHWGFWEIAPIFVTCYDILLNRCSGF